MKAFAWIRTVFTLIVVVLYFTVYTLVTLPIFWIIGLFSKKARERAMRASANTGLRLVLFLFGVHAQVIGFENIPKEPVAFISNHKSFFDMMCSYPLMHFSMGYVSKKEFAKILPFRIWLEWCGSIFVDRDNPREAMKTINLAAEKIKNGTSMWICPEGTRIRQEGLGEFHEGSFKIADKAGCKIVPVTMVHMEQCYEAHSPLVLPTKPYMIFGKPVDTAGLSREELKEAHAKVIEEIRKTYDEYIVKPYR